MINIVSKFLIGVNNLRFTVRLYYKDFASKELAIFLITKFGEELEKYDVEYVGDFKLEADTMNEMKEYTFVSVEFNNNYDRMKFIEYVTTELSK